MAERRGLVSLGDETFRKRVKDGKVEYNASMSTLMEEIASDEVLEQAYDWLGLGIARVLQIYC